MHHLRYYSIKKPKQSVTTPHVTYISHKITNLMTHNYVMISASLFYFSICFIFVPKFRLLVLYQEIDILATIEYLKTKNCIFI